MKKIGLILLLAILMLVASCADYGICTNGGCRKAKGPYNKKFVNNSYANRR